jgi:hypothetical protein
MSGIVKPAYKDYSGYHHQTGKGMWLVAVKAYELVKNVVHHYI